MVKRKNTVRAQRKYAQKIHVPVPSVAEPSTPPPIEPTPASKRMRVEPEPSTSNSAPKKNVSLLLDEVAFAVNVHRHEREPATYKVARILIRRLSPRETEQLAAKMTENKLMLRNRAVERITPSKKKKQRRVKNKAPGKITKVQRTRIIRSTANEDNCPLTFFVRQNKLLQSTSTQTSSKDIQRATRSGDSSESDLQTSMSDQYLVRRNHSQLPVIEMHPPAERRNHSQLPVIEMHPPAVRENHSPLPVIEMHPPERSIRAVSKDEALSATAEQSHLEDFRPVANLQVPSIDADADFKEDFMPISVLDDEAFDRAVRVREWLNQPDHSQFKVPNTPRSRPDMAEIASTSSRDSCSVRRASLKSFTSVATEVISLRPSISRVSCPSPAPSTVIVEPETPAIGDAPTFFPNDKNFKNSPTLYAMKLLEQHPSLSLCGIKPPPSFRPPCIRGNTDVTYKCANQYTHRMVTRWGSATRQLMVMRSIQDPKVQRSPLFEGLEVDLVKLYNTVQYLGGITACQNNAEKWRQVAQIMRLCSRAKTYGKLENIYLKYLLDYDALTKEEREKAISAVEKCWREREVKALGRARQPLWRQKLMNQGRSIHVADANSHLETVVAEAEECVTLGRTLNITTFKKMAKQIELNHFPNIEHPTPKQVEKAYWEILISAESHVCVHAASVDTTEHLVGFPVDQSDEYTKHRWNLKNLRCMSSNLLSYFGASLGVSSTSIHYGMAFTTSCWHMDPTSVPWIEYLHEGPPRIWYSIAADQEKKFRSAAEAICPFAVQNKAIWLPSDIMMIPPNLLQAYGVTVQRHEQKAGEYVIVYPNTYCACIDTGFTISEGVYFAPHNWIENIEEIFQNLRASCEPSLFSMEELLIAMAKNEKTPNSLLRRVQSVLTPLLCSELCLRQSMVDKNIELLTPEVFLEQNHKATATSWQIQRNGECAYCRRHLHLSRVVGVVEIGGVCSMHGITLFEKAVERQAQLPNVYCILLITNEEIYEIIDVLKQRVLGSVKIGP